MNVTKVPDKESPELASNPSVKGTTCPLCGKDMSIRSGSVFRCDREICTYWRMSL